MNIREKIEQDLKKIIKKVVGIEAKDVDLEHPENPKHGHYASNFALVNFKEFISLKKPAAADKKGRLPATLKGFKNPFDLAQKIVKNFPEKDYLKKVEAIKPGFINFHLSQKFLQAQVKEILDKKEGCGLDPKEKQKRKKIKVQVEFISANPTGPLHVGNCRGGFAGDTLANILKKLGYKVEKEFYVNDRGVQIEKLGQSVEARSQQLRGKKARIPEGGYPGQYVKEIARKAGQKKIKDFKKFALKEILRMIKKSTDGMGIKYDSWFSEDSLYQTSQNKKSEAEKALSLLKKKKLTYQKDKALWFKSTRFGDEKDRVLVKSNGETTYILSDLAYHINKFKKRRFNRVILFWGADHHGYVPRFLGMIEAIGYKGKAQVEICQLLRLARGKKTIRMSKRKGQYITVDNLLDEIGIDAARFHFLMHSLNTAMTLDLKKAAEKSEENPVYYVQYAHARICSILRKVKKPSFKPGLKPDFSLLNHPAELELITKLVRFPEVLLDIEANHQLQALTNYAVKLADFFHKFYEECRVIGKDKELTFARLALVRATQIILAESLRLMGISSPERM